MMQKAHLQVAKNFFSGGAGIASELHVSQSVAAAAAGTVSREEKR